MAGSASGDRPFTRGNAKQPARDRVRGASVHSTSGPTNSPDRRRPRSGRNFRILLGEPEVRLMMQADGVDEQQLLQSLDTVAAWLGKAAGKALRRGDDPSRPQRVPKGGKYRRGVGVVLLNRPGQVFVGRRADAAEEAWQPPQGGIAAEETPRAAALRELKEEIGTDNVEVIAESKGWITYDVPEALAQKAWGGRWRGQRQKWFVMLYLGRDDEIDIATEHPEFSAWRWAPLQELPSLAVPFKRRLYRRLAQEFESIVSERRRS
jgi:putative (di)nucleoside polyphosphate hydrolase